MSAPSPVRFGILGAARIVPNALLEPIRGNPEAAVVGGIAARDPARAQAFAAEHGLGRVLSSYDELVNDPDIDAIYNPLPNSLHCEWSIRALRAGKHVLCEKPLASNAAEAERMAEAADKSGRVLAEAFHYRYHPLAARIRELLGGGAIGRLQHLETQFSVPFQDTNDIRFDYALAGGATMDLGCYTLQMLRFFSGSTPRLKRAAARLGPPDVDVAMEADFDLPGGATARMSCSMEESANLWVSLEARGDGGELSVVNPLAPHYGHRLTVRTAAGENEETVPGDTTYAHQLRAFVAAVRGEAPMPTDAREGVENMKLIDAVYTGAGLRLRGA